MVASCSFVEEEFYECSKKKCVGLADSKSGLQDQNEENGSKSEGETEELRCEVFHCWKKSRL